MSRKIVYGLLLVCSIVLFGLQGCKKDVTVVIEPTGSTISSDKTISFSSDIVPIFNKSCSISGCHATGGKAPDLTDSKAFSSLNSGGYLDVAKPASSKLYLSLTGKYGMVMPIGTANNPSNLNNLVLAWITQGAKNN
jgi:hypothetical protein